MSKFLYELKDPGQEDWRLVSKAEAHRRLSRRLAMSSLSQYQSMKGLLSLARTTERPMPVPGPNDETNPPAWLRVRRAKPGELTSLRKARKPAGTGHAPRKAEAKPKKVSRPSPPPQPKPKPTPAPPPAPSPKPPPKVDALAKARAAKRAKAALREKKLAALAKARAAKRSKA